MATRKRMEALGASMLPSLYKGTKMVSLMLVVTSLKNRLCHALGSLYFFAALFLRRLDGEENRSGCDEEAVFRNIRCRLYYVSKLQIILQVAKKKKYEHMNIN
jgi:hypothetical protein